MIDWENDSETLMNIIKTQNYYRLEVMRLWQ